MTLPTSEDLQGISRWLQMQSLASGLVERRPELAPLVKVDDGARYLIVKQPAPGQQGGVVLARGFSNRLAFWRIEGPRSALGCSQVWESSIDGPTLSTAALAMHDAVQADTQVASPWRWSEPEKSPIVRLADLLAAGGMEVEAVVDRNRMAPDPVEGYEHPIRVPNSVGSALRLQMEWGTATIALKTTLGWVMDVSDQFSTRRLSLTDDAADGPAYRGDDLEQLTSRVARLAGQPGATEWDGYDNYECSSAPPEAVAVAKALRRMGYPAELRESEGPAEMSSPLFVRIVTRRTAPGLPEVQRAFAEATVAGKQLAMFSASGFTNPGARWADQAGALLFMVPDDGGHLWAANTLAKEHVPTVI